MMIAAQPRLLAEAPASKIPLPSCRPGMTGTKLLSPDLPLILTEQTFSDKSVRIAKARPVER